MRVYQTSFDGYFVSAIEADASPLEPGVFLVPAGCVEVAPPAFDADTQRAHWDGAGWIVEEILLPEPEPVPEPPPQPEFPPPVVPEIPEEPPLLATEYASLVRRTIEEQGVVLPNGVVVKSDVESQGKIAQTIQSIDLGLIEEPVNWKAKSGFVPLTRADLIAVGRAVAQHVQRAFNAEMAVMAQIDAGTIENHEQVDAAFVAALAPPDA
jgi:hypothetical protein